MIISEILKSKPKGKFQYFKHSCDNMHYCKHGQNSIQVENSQFTSKFTSKFNQIMSVNEKKTYEIIMILIF